MLVVLYKKLLLILVLWFAMLQAVAPFIHAHVEADSPGQGYGLHMHVQDSLQTSGGEHALKSVSAQPVHIIGVNDAVVKNTDLSIFPLFALLFIVTISAPLISLAGANLATHPFPQLYLRSLHRPRAPPLF